MTDARREYLRSYREKHGDPTAAERARRYRAKNPKRRDRPAGEFSREWANLDSIARRKRARLGPVIEKQGGRCAACGGVIRVDWIPGPEHYARPRREVEKAAEAGALIPEARVHHVGMLYDPLDPFQKRTDLIGEPLVAEEERSPLARPARAPKRNRWGLMTPETRERRARALAREALAERSPYRALSWHVPVPTKAGEVVHRGCQAARSAVARYRERVNAAGPRFSAIEEAWARQSGRCPGCSLPITPGEEATTSRVRTEADAPAPAWPGGARPPVVTLWHRFCRP
jgi:hypothetical protein